MSPPTGTALLILAVFVLPGFITLLLREWTYVPKGDDSPFDRLLTALFYSALIYAIAVGGAAVFGLDKSAVVDFYEGGGALGGYLGAAALVALFLPTAICETGRHWRRSKGARPWVLEKLGVSAVHGTYSGWEHMFAREGTALIRVTLEDGRVVGGYYGPDSFSGYSRDTQDLFLEQRWVLDDDLWFLRPADSSIGVWIPRDSIVSLETYDPPRADLGEGADGTS
jgi:hypothetical protein